MRIQSYRNLCADSSHDDLHWWLNGLNALRRPERWKAMSHDRGPVVQDEEGHALVEAILRRNALRTFEPMRDSRTRAIRYDVPFPATVPIRIRPEGLAGGGWRTMQLTSLEAVDILFGRQWGVRSYILEEDGVRNLETEGAVAFWKKWARERK